MRVLKASLSARENKASSVLVNYFKRSYFCLVERGRSFPSAASIFMPLGRANIWNSELSIKNSSRANLRKNL